MAIKPVAGMRCLKHQIECTYNCGWCGKPICEECLSYASGKKYCDKCWSKKQETAPKMESDTSKTSFTRQPIRNVDSTLDPKIAEQRRTSNEILKKKIF